MKALTYLFLLISLSVIGCCTTKNPKIIEIETVRVDTVYVEKIRFDTIYRMAPVMTDECLEYKLMIMNIRHYVQITESNKNNQKFFYGWIRRAVSEQ